MSGKNNNVDSPTITMKRVEVTQNYTSDIFSMVFNDFVFCSCFIDTIHHFISNNLVVILFTVLILGAFYYWVVLPPNRVKDFTELGYRDVEPKRLKAHVIRRLQEQRDVGDIPPPYPNGWFPLIESDAVKPGKAKHVSALGENFAVFRSKAGVVYILDAYCPHLGANMAVGGTVHDDCIECPFHGWRFSGQNGKCKSIPYLEKVPELINVKKWHNHDVNGFIFVWYHVDEEEPTWTVEEIPEIRSKHWVYRGRNDYTVHAHIQDIPENGCDTVHFAALHQFSVFSGNSTTAENLFARVMENLVKHKFAVTWDRHEEISHKTNITIRHEMIIFNKITMGSCDVSVQQIGPAYVAMCFKSNLGSVVMIQTVLPESPLQQRVIHRIYCPWYLALLGNIMFFAESVMFERDIGVWNQKKYLSKPFVVKGDGKINQYRKWFHQFYSKHSKTYQQCKKDLYDW